MAGRVGTMDCDKLRRRDIKDDKLKPSIRRAKPSDMSGMIRLLGILFSIETDFVIDEGVQQRGLEMMLEACDQRCIMVAELDNQQLVGMCTCLLYTSDAADEEDSV